MPAVLSGPIEGASESQMDLYNSYKAVLNDVGMQVGRRHFDRERFSAYLYNSGYPELAIDSSNLNKIGALQREKSEIGGAYANANFVGGSDSLVALAIYLAIITPPALIRNSQLDKELAGIKPPPPSFTVIAAAYNSRLAQSLVLSPTATLIYPEKHPAADLPLKAVLGVNAGMNDWIDDYALTKQNNNWYLGYESADSGTVLRALQPAGQDIAWQWSQRLPYAALTCDIAAVAFILAGGLTLANPTQSLSWLAGGVAAGGLGATLHWKSWKLETDVIARQRQYVREKLFPN
jgi:hypothetical protein